MVKLPWAVGGDSFLREEMYMDLSDLVGEDKVSIKRKRGEPFDVYPLSIANIAVLLKKYSNKFGEFKDKQVNATSILEEFPEIATEVLAMGAKCKVSVVANLPIGIQIKALEAIWELSELDMDHLGKLGTRFLEMLGGIGKNVEKKMNSSNGKKPSEESLKNLSQEVTNSKT